MPTPPYGPPTEADIALVSEYLGRPARSVVGVAARNAKGEPLVVATAPRLEDGSPFPTFYYLCHPEATQAASQLESVGYMAELNRLLEEDEELRSGYERAHAAYIRDRDCFEEVPELEGVSAGGMPQRVKCLHALFAHSLAAGEGVNPVGDIALRACAWGRETLVSLDRAVAFERD